MSVFVDSEATTPAVPAPLPAGGLKYVLVMPVWGDHHTDLFLRYFVPFLLTSGNVGTFPNRKLKFVLMSRRADLARMRSDIGYRRIGELTELIETEIDGIIDLSIPHRAMTECYLHAVRSLENPDDTVTIFPTPDCILSRNALRTAVSRMEQGWRGIMICGLRISMEKAGPLLDGFLARPGGADSIDERELTTTILKTLHPITLTCDVTSDEFMANWPSHVYWVAPDRSWLIAHCFHLHPIAVRGVPAKIDINTTIDGDYLMELNIGAEQLYICADSDDFICTEISPDVKRIQNRPGRFSKRALVRFSVLCNSLHRAFYLHAIVWRVSDNPNIPKAIQQDTEEMKAAVAAGSKYEEYRHQGIRFVRKTPVLLFLTRSGLFVARRVIRFGRYLLTLTRR